MEEDVAKLWHHEGFQEALVRFKSRTPWAPSWPKPDRPGRPERSSGKSWGSRSEQGRQNGRGRQAYIWPCEAKSHHHAVASMHPTPTLLYDHISSDQKPWYSERFADSRRSLSSSFTNCPCRALFGTLPRVLGQKNNSKELSWAPCRRPQRHIS